MKYSNLCQFTNSDWCLNTAEKELVTKCGITLSIEGADRAQRFRLNPHVKAGKIRLEDLRVRRFYGFQMIFGIFILRLCSE